MNGKAKLILFGAELLAIVVLRAVYLWRRDNKERPTGSRVDKVAGRPVYKFPFIDREPKKPRQKEKGFSWKPNPQFRRKTDPKSDSPETQST